MILVDTSVLVDFFRGIKNSGSVKLETILKGNIPFGISSFIYLEVLQGAGSIKEYNLLRTYLSSQRFYNPIDAVESFARAAKIYMSCRKKGITVRSTIDCLIVETAMENDLLLLHNDHDFELIQQVVPIKFY